MAIKVSALNVLYKFELHRLQEQDNASAAEFAPRVPQSSVPHSAALEFLSPRIQTQCVSESKLPQSADAAAAVQVGQQEHHFREQTFEESPSHAD